MGDVIVSAATSSIETETDKFTEQFPGTPSHSINPPAKSQKSQVPEKNPCIA